MSDRVNKNQTTYVANAMASGSLPVDPSGVFRDVLDMLSGAAEIPDSRIRESYAEELGRRIAAHLPDIDSIDFAAFYDGAVAALRPVRLEKDGKSGKSVWLAAAVDIPAMVDRACGTCPERDYADIEAKLERIALYGGEFEMDRCDSLLAGSRLNASAKPGGGKIAKAFAAAALATFMFLSAGESSSSPLLETVAFQVDARDDQKRIMGMLKTGGDDPVFSEGSSIVRDITWDSFERMAAGEDPIKQMQLVNILWNRIPYREDIKAWNREDYWASPGEFAKNGGDCEDYAIAKYLTLRKLGFAAENMRVLVVTDVKSGQAHAVLAVWHKGRAYILDNLSNMILPAEKLSGKYVPHASINENAIWKHIRSRQVAENRSAKAQKGAPASGGMGRHQ